MQSNAVRNAKPVMALHIDRTLAIEFTRLLPTSQPVPATTDQFSDIEATHCFKGLIRVDDLRTWLARVDNDGRHR
jgi:hypothetical protein